MRRPDGKAKAEKGEEMARSGNGENSRQKKTPLKGALFMMTRRGFIQR